MMFTQQSNQHPNLADLTQEPVDLRHFVVFADMLGFAALTEAYPIDLGMLQKSGRPGAWRLEDITKKSKNPLTEAFSNFHLHVNCAITIAKFSHAVTAITFSDSVFFASTSLVAALGFARSLAFSLLSARVPVRIGLGAGSFATVRFRSDIATDGGDHSAQFLGTAVVRAHQAESCGIKGMRALIHPSMEPMIVDVSEAESASPPNGNQSFRFLEVPSADLTNSTQVRYELDFWDSATTKEQKAWHALQDMWNIASDLAQPHYLAAAEAINRMRMSQGGPPLNDLRRRTLPRQTKMTVNISPLYDRNKPEYCLVGGIKLGFWQYGRETGK
jgi:hypothetical protein